MVPMRQGRKGVESSSQSGLVEISSDDVSSYWVFEAQNAIIA